MIFNFYNYKYILDSFLHKFDKKSSTLNSINIDKNDYMDFIKPLIKNNKVVVTVYIRVIINRKSKWFSKIKKKKKKKKKNIIINFFLNILNI